MKTLLLGAAVALWVVAGGPTRARAESVGCAITENGASALGTLTLLQGEREVARGACGPAPLRVPPGRYVAVVKLDGALDGPEQRSDLAVEKGKRARVAAAFQTGSLTVQIQRDGRRAAGVAIVRRGGTQVGSLGSGVAARLSTGTYEVRVRYRDEEKVFTQVQLTAGKPVVLEASF